MTPEEERALVARAAAGEEAAFERLVRAHEKLVYNAARKLTGNPEDAFDVAQEAFLRAWRHLSAFRGDSRFAVWLYRLTYNCAMDFLRKNRDANSLSLTDEEGNERAMNLPDDAPLPEEQVLREEQREAVRAAIRALPPEKRRILELREFEGRSYTEIAALLHIEEGTVKSRLARARASLAESLRAGGTFAPAPASKEQKGGRTP